MAPLLLHELEGATVSASDTRARLRPGVVYVPCALCRAPIDVTTIRSVDQPRLCAQHAD